MASVLFHWLLCLALCLDHSTCSLKDFNFVCMLVLFFSFLFWDLYTLCNIGCPETLCKPVWLQIHERSTCLSRPNIEIKGVHHTPGSWMIFFFNVNMCGFYCCLGYWIGIIFFLCYFLKSPMKLWSSSKRTGFCCLHYWRLNLGWPWISNLPDSDSK